LNFIGLQQSKPWMQLSVNWAYCASGEIAIASMMDHNGYSLQQLKGFQKHVYGSVTVTRLVLSLIKTMLKRLDCTGSLKP